MVRTSCQLTIQPKVILINTIKHVYSFHGHFCVEQLHMMCIDCLYTMYKMLKPGASVTDQLSAVTLAVADGMVEPTSQGVVRE